MRRFFYDTRLASDHLAVGQSVTLPDALFHHWCRVLRATVNEQAVLFDGTGGEYQVTLTQIEKKTAFVSVENFTPINRALPYAVHIGLVMSRGDRMDYAIQKATEMGVTAIHLLTNERCEVRLKLDQIAKKVEHWQGVAIAACEQCGLNRVPQLIPPIAITDFIQQTPIKSDKLLRKLVLAVPSENRISQTFKPTSIDFSQTDFCLLIGAEGGLSDDELNLALCHDFLPWQIGERVLRTETAPVVALSALQTIYTLCGQ